jgi:hypothetical protein
MSLENQNHSGLCCNAHFSVQFGFSRNPAIWVLHMPEIPAQPAKSKLGQALECMRNDEKSVAVVLVMRYLT